MRSRLSSGSGPLWLRHQKSPSSVTTFCPLLLLPGNGGEGVEVEASLLLACSPLLRRTLASTCCGACSGATVILPSTTSDALNQLVQVLAQGSVTIATDDLDELGTLLALLEVDFGRTAGVKRKGTNGDLETPPTVLRNSTSAQSDSSPTASSPAAVTSMTSCGPRASKLVAFNSSSPPPSRVDLSVSTLISTSGTLDWLVNPIPLSHASAGTHKITSPAKELTKSSISDPTASSPTSAGTSRTSCDPSSSTLVTFNSSSPPSSLVDPGPPAGPILIGTSAKLVRGTFEAVLAENAEEEVEEEMGGKKRSKRCGMCDHCTRMDCGVCKHCKKMTKFGGNGKSKQACLQRKCDSTPLSYASAGTVHKIKSPAEELTKSPITCFFCGLEMPSGTDQNLYLQHLETCNARQVLEADHLQKALKTEEEEKENGSYAGNNFCEEKGHLNKRRGYIYNCEEPGCGKSYNARDHLNNHKRSEHGAAKLKCKDSSCTVELVSTRNLENHMRSAHGAPKLPCNVLGCPSTFNSYQSLFKHIKTKHSAS